MADTKAVILGLSQQAEKHEKEIVTELAVDRFQTYIGVYALLTLSLVSKIANVIPGTNLSCYPIEANVTASNSYLNYAAQYCWLNKQVFPLPTDEASFTEAAFKQISLVADWLTLGIFFQAIILAIPGFLWHHVVTGRLLGHLKFVNTLMNDIYQKVKTLKNGAYRGKPYDKNGELLNSNSKTSKKAPKKVQSEQKNSNELGFRVFEMKEKKQSNSKMTKAEEGRALLKIEQNTDRTPISNTQSWNCSLDYLLYGNTIVDQHIFSLFCEENFAHLEYYAYIISISKLTTMKTKDDDEKKMYPIHQAILKLWMHCDNLTSRVLTKRYFRKHYICAFASIAFLAIYSGFLGLGFAKTFSMTTMGCRVPEYPALRCTYKHKDDVWFLYILNLFVLFIYFIMSAWKIISVRRCASTPSSHFFQAFKENSNVALLVVQAQDEAAVEEKDKKDNASSPTGDSKKDNEPTCSIASEVDKKGE